MNFLFFYLAYSKLMIHSSKTFFSPPNLKVSSKIEKARAPHSSALAWRIPWTEEPGRLQSMGSLRVGHD